MQCPVDLADRKLFKSTSLPNLDKAGVDGWMGVDGESV